MGWERGVVLELRLAGPHPARPAGKQAKLGEDAHWEYGAFTHQHHRRASPVPRHPPPHPSPRRGPPSTAPAGPHRRRSVTCAPKGCDATRGRRCIVSPLTLEVIRRQFTHEAVAAPVANPAQQQTVLQKSRQRASPRSQRDRELFERHSPHEDAQPTSTRGQQQRSAQSNRHTIQ